MLIEKNLDSEGRISDSLKIVNKFNDHPCQRTLTIMKKVIEMFPETGKASRKHLACIIVDQHCFLSKLATILETNPHLKDSLFDFVKLLMRYYKVGGHQDI